VVLPHVAPALLAAGLMAFTISFNEFVLAFFLTGGGFQTLPIYIYSLIRWESSPIINAVATVMLIFAAILVLLMYWVEGARALRTLGRRGSETIGVSENVVESALEQGIVRS
jgi:spermidine/putrescine transport system permease protein